jgi:hypothetical protein
VRRIRRATEGELHVEVGQLGVAAFVFAMRSCEYLEVESPRKTTGVRAWDVSSWKGAVRIELDDVREE